MLLANATVRNTAFSYPFVEKGLKLQ